MKIAVLSDAGVSEARVTTSPKAAKDYVKLRRSVTVAIGAFAAGDVLDADFEAVGAKFSKDNIAATTGADLVLSSFGADKKYIISLKKRAEVAGILNSIDNPDYQKVGIRGGVF